MKRILLLLFIFMTSLYSIESSKDKMILLYVEMEYCQWCKKMDREVFEDRDSLIKLQKLYNIKRVKKGDSTIPPFINTKFYPTTYILSSDGKKIIDELPGYMKASEYLDYLVTLEEVESSSSR